jgi:ABC-type sugar transport system permease subunit
MRLLLILPALVLVAVPVLLPALLAIRMAAEEMRGPWARSGPEAPIELAGSGNGNGNGNVGSDNGNGNQTNGNGNFGTGNGHGNGRGNGRGAPDRT